MPSIRRTIGNGIFYTALARYSNVFISIGITAVLARLLTPEEYGVVAIVAVFITFFNFLGDFGIGPAVIQNKELTETDLRSIFSFSLLFGLLLTSIFFLSAGFISHFYHEPELLRVSRWLSLSILFFSFGVVPTSLNKKKLLFKKIGIISVIVQTLSGITAIILAYYNFSYYALIIRAIINGVLLFVLNYMFSPVKLTLKIKKESIRKIFHFSSYQFLFNFINYFSRNTDNLLIGRYFGPAALGFYDKAYNLMLMPVQNLTHVITPVLHPVLSEYQNQKKRIFNSYMQIVIILATIGFPLSVFLYFSGNEVINIFYGEQWGNSVPVFQLLATIIGIQIVMSSSGSIFQATNRTDLLFLSGSIGAVMAVTGILYGIFIGKSLEAIGKGLIIAYSLNFIQAYFLLIKKALKSSLLVFVKGLIFPVILSAGVLAANLVLTHFPLENIYYSLLTKMTVSLIAFMVIFILPKKNRELLKTHIVKRMKKQSV